MWTGASTVDHNANMTHYSVILEDLEPETVYYIRVMPFVQDEGGLYLGTPTEESGPFLTLPSCK